MHCDLGKHLRWGFYENIYLYFVYLLRIRSALEIDAFHNLPTVEQLEWPHNSVVDNRYLHILDDELQVFREVQASDVPLRNVVLATNRATVKSTSKFCTVTNLQIFNATNLPVEEPKPSGTSEVAKSDVKGVADSAEEAGSVAIGKSFHKKLEYGGGPRAEPSRGVGTLC